MGLLKLGKDKNVSFNPLDEANSILKQMLSCVPISRAYLFGSGATDKFNSDSDLDLLLIFEDDADLREMQKLVYSRRWSALPIDFIIKNESDFEIRKTVGGVCFEAFHYGKELRIDESKKTL